MTNTTRVKLGCYATNITMAVVCNLPPVLFLTFATKYNISYTLLGLLVLINFSTQLGIDLVFSFFSHKFNIPKVVKAMPLFAIAGFVLYALWPTLSPTSAYIGLVAGTVLFSAASGFAEVLVSPVIAALPSDNPESDMSKLHAVYAWGAVGIILFSTVFLLVFGLSNWYILTLILTILPIVAFVLLAGSKLPEMETPEKVSGVIELLKNKGIWLCFAGIFLGGSSEVVMAEWSSGYLEKSLGIPKIWGDICGVALFSVALGFGRTLYGKRGKNIEKVLLLGASGAALCYLIAVVSPFPVIGLLACAFTGFCVSMLWPGSLIVSSGRFPTGGVFIYALMAAGGDCGASVGPQLVGLVTDLSMTNPWVVSLAGKLGISAEQLGLKFGMAVGMLFPLLAIIVFAAILKTKKNYMKKANSL